MKKEKTYFGNIYLGLRKEYTDVVYSIQELYSFIQDFCNEIKIGVTVTPTRFIYVDGYEEGAIIGLIQYPRFPMSNIKIHSMTIDLGMKLLKKFEQERLTVVFPDETIMIEKEDLK